MPTCRPENEELGILLESLIVLQSWWYDCERIFMNEKDNSSHFLFKSPARRYFTYSNMYQIGCCLTIRNNHKESFLRIVLLFIYCHIWVLLCLILISCINHHIIEYSWLKSQDKSSIITMN